MGSNNKAILSNLLSGVSMDPSELHKGISKTNQVIYSRYLYKRNQGDVSSLQSDLSKELAGEYNNGFVKEIEPLIWYLFSMKMKATNSCFNVDGVYQEILLMNPPVEYMPGDLHSRFTVSRPVTYTEQTMNKYAKYFFDRLYRG